MGQLKQRERVVGRDHTTAALSHFAAWEKEGKRSIICCGRNGSRNWREKKRGKKWVKKSRKKMMVQPVQQQQQQQPSTPVHLVATELNCIIILLVICVCELVWVKKQHGRTEERPAAAAASPTVSLFRQVNSFIPFSTSFVPIIRHYNISL